ncbi:MAG: hypothetical protein VB962_00925 [Pseudohongiellaceae bacterium]
MKKYLSIIDRKTAEVVVICITVTYLCYIFDFSFDLNVMFLSISVVFPLVFTIRAAFKRRDNVIRLLSIFKSSLNAVYHCFAINTKLSDSNKKQVADKLNAISIMFFGALRGEKYDSNNVRDKINEVFCFLNDNRDSISNSIAIKIIRFLKDVHASIENTVGIKMHGTPVSLRAYCLIFIYMFPFLIIPTLFYDLGTEDPWIVYALGIMHGFILISLYNVQNALENPFDQVGLDDIKLEEFYYQNNLPALDKA